LLHPANHKNILVQQTNISVVIYSPSDKVSVASFTESTRYETFSQLVSSCNSRRALKATCSSSI